MSDVEKPISLNSNASEVLPDALARSLVKQCRAHAEHYVKTLFEPLAKQLDDDLFKLAEKTQEIEKAQLYNDAMLKLRSDRAILATKFSVTYSQSLNQALDPDGLGIDTSGGDEGLSLVGDAQLEESLVINQITFKVFEEYSDELYALEQRLSLILPNLKMDEGQVPFSSGPICNAFEALLRPLDFDIKVKLAIYRSLERTLLASIGGVFDELNEVLRQAGVLPEIKRKAKKSESIERVTKSLVDTATSENSGTGGGASDDTRMVPEFHSIQQLAGLFSEVLSDDPEKQQALLTAQVTPQLVEALSGLQISNDLLEAGAELSGEELKARIKAQLSEREGAPAAGISQLDDETIDVISMIFDDLMGDDSLPDAIKALVFRLQIPVLKAAIIDRVFFAEKEHPARVLLNELTLAGQLASADDDDVIYQKIESVVICLTSEFQGNLEIFETCRLDLCNFMREQETGFQQAQLKIGEAAKQKPEKILPKRLPPIF